MMREQLPHRNKNNNWYGWVCETELSNNNASPPLLLYPHHTSSIDNQRGREWERPKLLHHKMSAFQLTMIDYELV